LSTRLEAAIINLESAAGKACVRHRKEESMKTETAPQAPERPADEMPLLGIDHVELYVGNASQAAYFFTHALGFRRTAYAGLESGTRDRASRCAVVVWYARAAGECERSCDA